jgi:hypothetical protein
MIKKKYFLLLFVLLISFTIFSYEYSFRGDEIINLAYAHIFPGTPNAVFIEKDGYQIGFLPYPKNPKVNDDTLLNLNVQENGNDVGNTFVSLIIMDKNTNKIVHQVPYKFYSFADMSYPYVFKHEGKYSLSLLTKIAGDGKYENNPLIVTFQLDTDGIVNKISSASSIIIYSVIALSIIICIVFIYRTKLKLIINKKFKP